MALASANKSFTSCAIVWGSRLETQAANNSQCPDGNSELGPSAQYSAMTLCRVTSLSCTSTAWCAWPRKACELSEAGGPGRDWLALASAKGCTRPQCGAMQLAVSAPLWLEPSSCAWSRTALAARLPMPSGVVVTDEAPASRPIEAIS
jgi:hypothetical protein